jgi:hypothetical protein
MKIAYTYHVLLQYWKTTALKSSSISTKKHMQKHCSPSPCGFVFHVGVECWVIRVIRADVAKVSCVMEAMLYDLGVESSSETVTIIDTHPGGLLVMIKYAREGSLQEEADLWGTPANA